MVPTVLQSHKKQQAMRWIIRIWLGFGLLGAAALGYALYGFYTNAVFQERYLGAAIAETVGHIEKDGIHSTRDNRGRSSSSRFITYRYRVTSESTGIRLFVRRQQVFMGLKVMQPGRTVPVRHLVDHPEIAGIAGDELEMVLGILPLMLSLPFLVLFIGPGYLAWRHRRRQSIGRLPGSSLPVSLPNPIKPPSDP